MASLVSFFDAEPHKPPAGTQPLRVEQVDVSEARKFDVGHPELGVAYVRHPVVPKRLLMLASYHADIVAEKTNDAILMLTALGASSIELNYSTQVSSEVKADLELLFGMINIGAKDESDEKVNVLYAATGTGAPLASYPS